MSNLRKNFCVVGASLTAAIASTINEVKWDAVPDIVVVESTGTSREGGERLYFAVAECDVLVMDGITTMTMYAFGIATALRKDVIVVTPEPSLSGVFRFAMTAGCRMDGLRKLLSKMV